MIRGTKKERTLPQALIIGVVVLSISSAALAVSAKRAIPSSKGDVAAPSKQDSQDYFAVERKGVSKEDAAKADELRVKTIEQIKNLIAKQKSGKNEFELLIRLGELHIERADYQRDQEIEYYISQYDKWEKADPKARGKAPLASYKASESQIHLAVKSFRRIVTKFPRHPRTDAALYSLANALSRLEDENSVLYYKQLIAQFPKSPLVPDSWLALGEFYFDKHKIEDARKSYQQVMAYKEHRAYPFAIYKLGWCYYNSQGVNEKSPGDNLLKSIAAFKLVVKISDGKTKKNYNLREEAIRDLVMAFAETEDTDAAWKYFKSIGEEDKFYVMLDRLGSLYADAGKNEKAIEVYTRLVKESPTKKGTPKTYQKLVELYEVSNQLANVVTAIKTMHSLFAVPSSPWIRANSDKPELVAEASTITERTTHRYGTMLHARGQKSKSPSIEAHGAEIYAAYLASYPSKGESYEIRYYLADIQMNQGKFEEAASNFVHVAKQKPKDGKYTKTASLMAVTAVAKLNEKSKLAAVPPAGQVSKPMELPRVRKLYVDTIDFYTQILPNEKDGHAMRFTAAQILYDYGHYSEALKRFDDLALNLPQTPQGKASTRVNLAFYAERTDWPSVIATGRKYQKNNTLMADSAVKKHVEDSLRAALFNHSIAFEKSKEYEKAAVTFLDFKRSFPTDPNADKALYNASVNYFKAGMVEDTLIQQKALLQEYPKSSLAPEVMATMGETYEALGQFRNAADTYYKFAQTYPNDKRAPSAMYNAAVMYRGSKGHERSASVFAELRRKYPSHPAANDALFEAGRIQESLGNQDAATIAYKDYAQDSTNKNKDSLLYALAKVVELSLAKSPTDEKAKKDLNKLVSQLKAKGSPPAPEARRVVASILFNRQESAQNSFKTTSSLNGDTVEKQARQKQAQLEQLARAYEEVISVGNAEFAVASLYRLGELHEGFAKALFETSPPSKATPAEATAFKSQLEKAAFPLKEEAYKFFETAYRRSQEVESFSDWTTLTYKKMVDLAPQNHKEINEQSANPGYLSHKVTLTSATEGLTK